MARNVGIVGAGIAGLHLALYLQKHGVDATVITDRPPEEYRDMRLLNTVAHHHVLVLPPYFDRNVTPDGIEDAFAAIIDGVADERLRAYLYHIPQVSGVAIPTGVAASLRKRYGKVIAGLKDSSGDFKQFQAFRAAAPELAITVGNEADIARAMAAGGAGTICGMSFFKKSVSKLLLVLMALLAAGALASTAFQMLGAFGRYSDSLETERLAAADKAIFHGVLALRNNRGDAQSALLGEDDPRAKLGAAEKAELAGYDAIVAALSTVEFARRDELASTLKQRWSEAAPKFQLFYDEARLPRAERKVERTAPWYDGVTKVIETANLASTAVSNRAWTNDPFIARMGFVGAGGIGQELVVAIRKFYYSDVSAILLTIIVTVFLIDISTGWLRGRLFGKEART